MFRKPITFVIGAGASCELGLPSGDQLTEQILSLLAPVLVNSLDTNSNEFVSQLFHHKLNDLGKDGLNDITSEIVRGLPLAKSIDNFLYTKNENHELVSIGKAAIAHIISREENRSALMGQRVPEERPPNPADRVPRFAPQVLKDVWLWPFAQLLFAGTTRESFKESLANVRFVIFNYDRCVEQFLFMAAQNYFHLDEASAAEVLSDVEFIHPYGSLGELPWQNSSKNQSFGGYLNPRSPFEMGSELLTFTESVESATTQIVEDAIGVAETLVFLGFGFLRQNMELLRGERMSFATKRVFATAFKLERADQEVVQKLLLRFLGDYYGTQPTIELKKCRKLFDSCAVALSYR